MLRFCLDDGGHPRSKPVFAIAGYVAPIEGWDAFERDWATALRRAGVDVFRMAQLRGQRGYGPYKGWRQAKRESFIQDMAATIDRHLRQGVARAIFVEDFDDIVVPESEVLLTGTSVKPLAAAGFCLRMCLEWLACQWEGRIPGQKINVILERGTDQLDEAVTYCNRLIAHEPWGEAFGIIGSETKTSLISLHAADFLANHAFHSATTKRDGRSYTSSRPGDVVSSLGRSQQHCRVSFGYQDRHNMTEMLAYFRTLMRRQPGDGHHGR